jgi:hypothetical protein
MAIKWIKGPQAGTVEYEGAVLTGVYDRYLGHDRYSDRVDVWTGSEVKVVQVGTGYCDMTERLAIAEKDADAATIEKARVWTREREAKRAKEAADIREAKEAMRPAKGKRVRVYKGKKVPVGTVGVVFWTGFNRYNPKNPRVGLKDDSGETLWTYMDNLEVLIG